MKTLYITLFCSLVGHLFLAQNLINHVDPFIGTGGHGHTYPGATAPFGFMQLSPDTRLDGWDGCSAYHHSDDKLYGFSHTHLSGTGVSDYADLLIMPFDPTKISKDSYGRIWSKFSHENEKSEPGFYSVTLENYNIQAALSATSRAGIQQYKFGNNKAHMVLDLDHRDRVLDFKFEILDDKTIRGKRISSAWATEQHFYFFMKFSESFKVDSTTLGGKRIYLNFGNQSEVEIRIGISAVDYRGAQLNLEGEIGIKNFENVKLKTQVNWENELSKIQIFTSDQNFLKIYYTALYHSFLSPNIFSDLDGRYRGTDKKIHRTSDKQYTVFSLWDTFRAAHPLFTIVQSKRTEQFINTLLRHYLDGGKLPMWELAGNYTGCMIGYHAIPVIVDAYMKGYNNFDKELALQAMLDRANQNELGIPALIKFGFIPVEEEHESVSKTLEYAYNDWCIAIMAQDLGKTDIATTFFERAQFYKNQFNPMHGFMQGKLFNSFQEPFDPREVNFNYTEGNSWQYSFFALHDIQGMIELFGGNEAFIEKLDGLFSASTETTGRQQVDITGLIGQYAHGNEPSHHIAFLYNYAGQPHKTQLLIRQIIQEMYSSKPDGLSGNEDCGQMSAWLNLAALGIYSVTPGSTQYTLTSPYVDSAFINLENGSQFNIIAHHLSDKNIYIQRIMLNGELYEKLYIEHADIMAGGCLEFVMGPNSSDFGANNPPHSKIQTQAFSIVPYFDSPKRTFSESLCVKIKKVNPNQQIFYTLDGSEPNRQSTPYSKEICLDSQTKIKAITYLGQTASKVIETEYFKIPANRKISIHSTYSTQYSAGGHDALINLQKGGKDFRTGAWQGYQGQNFSATLDLGKKQIITKVGANFIQDIRSWIWLPKNLTVEVSVNGRKWEKIAFIKNTVSPESYEIVVKEMIQKIKPTKARYVKFTASYYGKIPSWHVGAGGESYIFIDELIVE